MVAHRQFVDIADIRTLALLRLNLHFERISVRVEVVHVERRDLTLQRVVDLAFRLLQRCGRLRVHVQEELRRTRRVRTERVRNVRKQTLVVEHAQQFSHIRFQRLRRAVLIREHEGNAARRAEPHNRRRLERRYRPLRDLGTTLHYFVDDIVDLRLRRLTKTPVVQLHDP